MSDKEVNINMNALKGLYRGFAEGLGSTIIVVGAIYLAYDYIRNYAESIKNIIDYAVE